jgi:hypothetical protein
MKGQSLRIQVSGAKKWWTGRTGGTNARATAAGEGGSSAAFEFAIGKSSGRFFHISGKSVILWKNKNSRSAKI